MVEQNMFGKLFVDEEVLSYVQGNDPASLTALHGIKINQIFTLKFFSVIIYLKVMKVFQKAKKLQRRAFHFLKHLLAADAQLCHIQHPQFTLQQNLEGFQVPVFWLDGVECRLHATFFYNVQTSLTFPTYLSTIHTHLKYLDSVMGKQQGLPSLQISKVEPW